MESSLLSILLMPLILPGAVVNARQDNQPTCYYPDRSIDTRGLPCNGSAVQSGAATASACCLPNDACYDSGACFQDWSGVMYRQSCTDPTFRDPKCPQLCVEDGMLSVGIWVQTCEMGVGKACCLIDETSCCNGSSKLFDFKPGYIKAVLNGDGTNRLLPYTDGKEVTYSSPAPLLSSSSSPLLLPSFVSTTVAKTTDAVASASTSASLCRTEGKPANPRFSNSAIAATSVLAVLLALTATTLVFLIVKTKSSWVKRATGADHSPEPPTVPKKDLDRQELPCMERPCELS
ncbi:hypothetical protein F5Y19DRAFT_479603 [Xylariaceae sp. FL1651]|nr:hypothetical protein F5Y19DRAFT_479603 [Xylariaceae sp. FL1651]